MPKNPSLKEKLEGNELDLSLGDLTAVPVRELAALPKATHLDLSCNLLTVIPDDFCSLTHIVKLDMSKNQITSLPRSFGALQKLQYLDLFSNKLTTLPISLCHLKNLKWLDLKDNPLDNNLQDVAGDCLNDVQCKTCAKQVVTYMKSVQSEQERQLQQRLEDERRQDAARKVDEEQERKKVKAEKAALKDKRRQEYDAKQREKKSQEVRPESHRLAPEDGLKDDIHTGITSDVADTKERGTGGLSCCGVFIAMIFGLAAVFIGLYFYCENNKGDLTCIQGRKMGLNYYREAETFLQSLTKSK